METWSGVSVGKMEREEMDTSPVQEKQPGQLTVKSER